MTTATISKQKMNTAHNPFQSKSSRFLSRRNPGKQQNVKLMHICIAMCFLVLLIRQPKFDSYYEKMSIGDKRIKEAATTHVHLSDVVEKNESDTIPSPPNESIWLLTDVNTPSNNVTTIPHTLNKIYFQKNGRFDEKNMSERLSWAHQTWHDLNPGFEVRYFSLKHARKYLKQYFHPIFLRTFDCIQAFAGKSDFFRMVLLYREGGFHSDWKEACVKEGILESISNETDFFAAVDFGFTYASVTRSCAQNAFVGSIPRHRILSNYLQLAMINVQNSSYPENTLLATGPCLFGKAIKEVDETFGQDETITSGKYGQYKSHQFFWKGESIVHHRCCGWGQDWGENGNNYNILFQEKKYYCEDAAALFDAI